MKLLTREDIQKVPRKNAEDEIARAIQDINKKVKARHADGRTTALLGFDDATFSFYRLAPMDRAMLMAALRTMGYLITSYDPGHRCVRIDWSNREEEELL